MKIKLFSYEICYRECNITDWHHDFFITKTCAIWYGKYLKKKNYEDVYLYKNNKFVTIIGE